MMNEINWLLEDDGCWTMLAMYEDVGVVHGLVGVLYLRKDVDGAWLVEVDDDSALTHDEIWEVHCMMCELTDAD